MEKIAFTKLKNLCVASGFAQKGKTFFRIVGDGVLQIIKCKYQRNLGGDIISVGLFSMYGYLKPEWLTTTGSIPRYSIINCFYQNNIPLLFAPPLQTQLDMLSSHVLPWLDTLDTQKKLIRAIAKLDPRWNDRIKIGPYLACGEINHAKKILREILAHYDFGRISEKQYCEDSNGMLFLSKEQEGDNPQALLEMIARENPEEIDNYLKKNYTRNMEYAKFCVKNYEKT